MNRREFLLAMGLTAVASTLNANDGYYRQKISTPKFYYYKRFTNGCEYEMVGVEFIEIINRKSMSLLMRSSYRDRGKVNIQKITLDGCLYGPGSLLLNEALYTYIKDDTYRVKYNFEYNPEGFNYRQYCNYNNIIEGL